MYLDLPSPFLLPRPSEAWLETVFSYDRDLVIYPSQKTYVYRLARRARFSARMNGKIFGKMHGLHPDTKVCLQHGLVSVTTIPVAAIWAAPERIVAQLANRDTWRFPDVDAIADKLDARDAAKEAAIDAHNREELRTRARAMRVAYLHRTGARVSLVRPVRRPVAPDSTPTPGGGDPVAVST